MCAMVIVVLIIITSITLSCLGNTVLPDLGRELGQFREGCISEADLVL